MKEKNLPIVLFVCMGMLLALMYGVFELGGFEMRRCEKVFCIILIISIVAFACFEIWTSKSPEIFIKGRKMVFCGDSCNSLYIADKDNCVVPKGTESVIVIGNFCLRDVHFENIEDVKKIYFYNKKHRVDADLFNSIKKKIVIIDKTEKIVIEFYSKN